MTLNHSKSVNTHKNSIKLNEQYVHKLTLKKATSQDTATEKTVK